ncbi:hypothetical protein RFI_01600 [Reticulomyxa filosa]|uniref:Programmed cell death protein 2 C-terminal domain-containing protein n=1 Tax=Reticulomyxa filosa TaxID=46433 RepID=X6PBH4_RETFI|nr:hypothetical protein RFI_01600 [Reticulomyxa filosa]|eukprot:ETO35463.1 hypothetical protein RFI_01600 [Reticulomyxa filosa]
MCADSKCCGKNGSIIVLRSQLPRVNPYYEINDIDSISEEEESKLLERLQYFMPMQLGTSAMQPTIFFCFFFEIVPLFFWKLPKNRDIQKCKKLCPLWSQESLSLFQMRKSNNWILWNNLSNIALLQEFETWADINRECFDYWFPLFSIEPEAEPLDDGIPDDLSKVIYEKAANDERDDEGADEVEEEKDLTSVLQVYKHVKTHKTSNDYNESELEALEKAFGKDFDDVFINCLLRIQRAPGQIIRYAEEYVENNNDNDNDEPNENENTITKANANENKDENKLKNENENETYHQNQNSKDSQIKWVEPLWVCKDDIVKNPFKEIPNCPRCGSARRFEFQIMPQLLDVLKQGINGFDWGTLVVYSCINSCGDGITQGYVTEYIHYQRPAQRFEDRDPITGEIG